MVPMADMLNAAYERDNARLFADGDDDDSDDEDEEEKKKSIAAAKRFGEGYTMITTKPVKAGEQIVSLCDMNQLMKVQHLCVPAQL